MYSKPPAPITPNLAAANAAFSEAYQRWIKSSNNPNIKESYEERKFYKHSPRVLAWQAYVIARDNWIAAHRNCA